MCLRESPPPFAPGIVWPCTFVATTYSSRIPNNCRSEGAGDLLALALVVDVGGVEEEDPTLDGPAHDRLRLRRRKRPLAARRRPVAHHSEADPRHPQSGRAEVHDLHRPDATDQRQVGQREGLAPTRSHPPVAETRRSIAERLARPQERPIGRSGCGSRRTRAARRARPRPPGGSASAARRTPRTAPASPRSH